MKVSGTIVNFIIQLIAGAVGGNAARSSEKYQSRPPRQYDRWGRWRRHWRFNPVGTYTALGSAASGAGGFDIGVLAGQLAGGGITGAIVTAVVGLIKNALIKKA
jgi:hypothetical protein